MARPANLPTYATAATYTDGPDAGTATKVAFTAGDIAQGNIRGAGYAPSPQKFNWWMNLVGSWISEFADEIDALSGGGGESVVSSHGFVYSSLAPSQSEPDYTIDLSGTNVYLTSVHVVKDASGVSAADYDLKLEISTNGGSTWQDWGNDVGEGDFSSKHSIGVTWDEPLALGTNARIRVSNHTNDGESESHNLRVYVTYIGGGAPLATANVENEPSALRAYATELDFDSNVKMHCTSASGTETFTLGSGPHTDGTTHMILFDSGTASAIAFDSGDFGSTFANAAANFDDSVPCWVIITKQFDTYLVTVTQVS